MSGRTKGVFWFVIFGFIVYYAFSLGSFSQTKDKPITEKQDNQQIEPVIKKKNVMDKPLHAYIGKDAKEIKETFGTPTREDLSAYDYTWWVYEDNVNHDIQIGILNDKVVTIFALGKQLHTYPFEIGQPFDKQVKGIERKKTQDIQTESMEVEMTLTDEEYMNKPLIHLGNAWAQLYRDHYTDELVAVRYSDSETLIKQRAYNFVYRGEIEKPAALSNEQLKEIEQSNQKQIFHITNHLRKRYGVSPLAWHEEAAQTAYTHSEDMATHDYFSHTSPTSGTLAERLTARNIVYQSAGENIAAKYMDGPAVVIGWLNSESHRQSLLYPDFTHLGVGVYQEYYTQNFIQNILH
ncbi:CAP domain-containing protein [Bacillus tianshenii]|nr:CAP domain-containing protein [Bacillus tianshenii]